MPEHKDIITSLQYCRTMLDGIIDNARKIDVIETHGAGTKYEFQSQKYPSAKGFVRNDIIHLRRVLNDIRSNIDRKG